MTLDKSQKQASRYFSDRLENKQAMVRVIGLDKRVRFENQAFIDVFGKTRKMECSKTIGDNSFCPTCPIYHPKENLRFGQKAGNAEIDGQTYFVDVSPVMLSGGEMGAIEVFRDITNETEQHESLLASHKKMTNDLEVARTLQLSILRDQLPDVKGYDFSSVFMPCETLGGDMYDCFRLSGDQIAMYIADVSGHGVMSAMLTVYLRQEIFSQFKKHKSPDDVLYGVYESYLDLNIDSSVYITVFILVMDLKTGKMKFTNAGHSVSPLLFDGVKVEEITQPGMPVCSWQKPDFEWFETTLKPGGCLLLYTDGLDDVHLSDHSIDGIKQLIVTEKLKGQALLDKIISGYATTMQDDVTLLLAEREA